MIVQASLLLFYFIYAFFALVLLCLIIFFFVVSLPRFLLSFFSVFIFLLQYVHICFILRVITLYFSFNVIYFSLLLLPRIILIIS